MGRGLSRRQFLKWSALAGAWAVLPSPPGRSARTALAGTRLDPYIPALDLAVAGGGSPAGNTMAAVEALGGFRRFVRPGDKVVLKPNPVGTAPPHKAVCTHPEILEAVVKACREAGAREVLAVSNDDEDSARRNGTVAAIERAGGRIRLRFEEEEFRPVHVPRGRILHQARILGDILDGDVFINLPIAKHHAATKVTLSMKNLMGVVHDAISFHRLGLHQCIADLTTAIPHDLVIMDANHVLLTNGPVGPGKVIQPGQVIAGIDPVAVDAYALRYFDLQSAEVDHIVHAWEQGAGEMDVSRLGVEEIRT